MCEDVVGGESDSFFVTRGSLFQFSQLLESDSFRPQPQKRPGTKKRENDQQGIIQGTKEGTLHNTKYNNGYLSGYRRREKEREIAASTDNKNRNDQHSESIY